MARKLVLVVDDEEVVRELVQAVVEEEFGASVAAAGSAEAASALLRASPPDAVVLDLALGGADGFAFLERVRAELADRAPPVVVLSGVSAHGDARARALALGCAAFVRKPFDLADLTDALAPLLRAPGAERTPDRAT